VANSSTGDSVIDRLVRVLATFDAEHTEQSSSDIARRARLPTSTGHRLVADLVGSGLLERTEDGRARVGMRLWELATRGSLALGLRQAALPAMERVQSLLRQHTQLGVADGDQVLFLERLSHPRAGANITRIAGRLPLHASSSGLVLLAAASPPMLDRILAAPLERLAPETISDPGLLRRKLAEVRRLGYAIAPGSIEAVSTGVAVPLRDRGVVVAALGVVLPRGEENDRVVTILRAAAGEIEAALAAPSRSSTVVATPRP
jgi:DNA-binding IclR family transcriptional regulator